MRPGQVHRLSGMVLILALIGGCAVSTEKQARVAPDDRVPFALLDPHSPPLVTPKTGPTLERVGLCLVKDRRLVTAATSLAPPVGLSDALDALWSVPTDVDPSLRTALSEGALVGGVKLTAGIAQVDLARTFTLLRADEQLLAVAQIVCTLTGRPGVGQVAFTLEAVPLAVPQGDGSLSTAPVSKDDYASLLG